MQSKLTAAGINGVRFMKGLSAHVDFEPGHYPEKGCMPAAVRLYDGLPGAPGYGDKRRSE